MADHARLGPSAAYRWINCPASITRSEGVSDDIDESNFAANRGTDAHSIAELAITNILKDTCKILHDEEMGVNRHLLNAYYELKNDDKLLTNFQQSDLDLLVDYVSYVALSGYWDLHIEKKIDLGCICTGTFGTADAVMIDDRNVEIVDLKFGRVPVEAKNNYQLMLYLIGVLHEQGLTDIRSLENMNLRVTIYQPLYKNTTHKIDPIELWQFYQIARSAARSVDDKRPIAKAGDHCKYCKALAYCTTAARSFFDDLDDSLDVDQIDINKAVEIYEKKSAINAMIGAIENRILNTFNVGDECGNAVITTKLTRSKWRDVADEELETGLGELALEKKPIGITKARKIFGAEAISPFLEERTEEKIIKIINNNQ